MWNRKKANVGVFKFTISAGLLLCGIGGARTCAAQAPAGPVVKDQYTLKVFAKSTDKYSQPDSIAQWHDRIFIGYQNHVAKDGSDGKSSTIVEYSLTGKVLHTFSVPGHNDGLRVVGEDDLWCIQNEDANPNLVVIDLPSGSEKKYTFAPTVHGGGYDDIIVKDGRVLITASNPSLNGAGKNVFPALVEATLHGSMVDVRPILGGDATATDIPTNTSAPLNLTDPDSLTIDARGDIVLDSQGDMELIFIRNPFSSGPTVGKLSITVAGVPTTLDDTAFAPDTRSFLLFSDVGGDKVYRIDDPAFGFEPGTAYTGSDTTGIVGTLNLDTGDVTPIATGFVSVRGMSFVTLTEDDRGSEDR